MMLGMSLETFTLVHVILSLIGIATGYLMMFGWIAGKTMDGMVKVYLISTIATSVTGFGFPFVQLLPSHIFGVISLVVLTLTCLARYRFALAKPWRTVYVITAAFALYLNTFVLVVQSFLKVDALKAIAPTQSEAPFVVTQVVALAFISVLTILVETRHRRLPQTAQAQ